jgi:hypothetical protein
MGHMAPHGSHFVASHTSWQRRLNSIQKGEQCLFIIPSSLTDTKEEEPKATHDVVVTAYPCSATAFTGLRPMASDGQYRQYGTPISVITRKTGSCTGTKVHSVLTITAHALLPRP